MSDTAKIINALKEGIEAHQAMIDLIQNGRIIIDTMERVSMLSIALGAMYHAYTNEVIPILDMQGSNQMSMN